MADLTIDGERFRVDVEGDAAHPVLMLSNSLGTDLSMWAEQVPALTTHFRVVRYDPRGHGGGPTAKGPVSLARLGRDAVAILDALEIDKVHWLGLSMGGAVGLWLLVNAPDRIDRAVLANTAPKLGNADGWNARIVSILAKGMDENAASTIERWFGPRFAARAPDRVGAIHKMLRTASPQGYAACCAALRDMDLRESLRSIGHDILVVSGRDDPVVPPDDVVAFVAAIDGARHVELDTRHMSNIEAASAFNAAVIAFLTTRPRARALSVAAKRGAAKRPNAKKPPAKRMPVKRVAARTATPKRAAVSRRSNAARNPLKKSAAKRGGAPAPSRTSAAKKAVRKRAASPRPKATTTRRSTSTTAARGPVKKARPKKAGLKSSAKKASVKSVKKLPVARRRPAKRPRRPSGRRKT